MKILMQQWGRCFEFDSSYTCVEQFVFSYILLHGYGQGCIYDIETNCRGKHLTAVGK